MIIIDMGGEGGRVSIYICGWLGGGDELGFANLLFCYAYDDNDSQIKIISITN